MRVEIKIVGGRGPQQQTVLEDVERTDPITGEHGPATRTAHCTSLWTHGRGGF